jgi:hypothetical protein
LEFQSIEVFRGFYVTISGCDPEVGERAKSFEGAGKRERQLFWTFRVLAKCDKEFGLAGRSVVFSSTVDSVEEDGRGRFSQILGDVGCGGLCGVDECGIDVVGSGCDVLPGFAEEAPVDESGVSEDVDVWMPFVLLDVVSDFENCKPSIYGFLPQCLLA